MIALYHEVPRLTAARRLDAATAADYPGWKPATRSRWWKEQAALISGPRRSARRSARRRQAGQDVPYRRTAALFWNSAPIGGGGLKRELAGALGGGFSA
jgi:hypothetical protein